VADSRATSGLARCCRLPYVRADGRDATVVADSVQVAGRSGSVAVAMEAGGVPKRWARGSVLRGGGQSARVRRRRGPIEAGFVPTPLSGEMHCADNGGRHVSRAVAWDWMAQHDGNACTAGSG
jgi:hypothetical protein